MSDPARLKAAAGAADSRQRRRRRADMFGNRRPIGGLGMPTQKAKNFKGTLVRLLGYLRPHRAGLVVVILAGAIGTVFSVLGPKILGLATTKIFEGFVAKAPGVPGAAIDFDYVGRILLGLIVLVPRRQHLSVPDAVPDGRRRAEHRLRDAPGGRGQVRSAAAEVLRLADARRGDEPRGERSRQHQLDAAAEPHAAADVGADAHRRHRHDAHDQLDPDARDRPDAAAQHRRSSRASPSGRRSSS